VLKTEFDARATAWCCVAGISDAKQFQKLLASIKVYVTVDRAYRVLRHIDSDCDGNLTIEEFYTQVGFNAEGVTGTGELKAGLTTGDADNQELIVNANGEGNVLPRPGKVDAAFGVFALKCCTERTASLTNFENKS